MNADDKIEMMLENLAAGRWGDADKLLRELEWSAMYGTALKTLTFQGFLAMAHIQRTLATIAMTNGQIPNLQTTTNLPV